MRRYLLSCAALAAAPLLLPTAVSAATQLGTSPDVAIAETPLAGCPGISPAPCSVGQDRLSNLDLRISENGVVVRWRLHGEGGQARLRRIGGGATAAGALPASAGAAEFAAQLPVRAGDRLAVDLLDGAQISRQPAFFSSDADLADTWSPPLADGETRAPSSTFEGYLLYQADVEPDRDGDGLGDESQDPDHGTPVTPPGPPTPPETPRPPVIDPPVTPADPYAGLPAAGPTLKLAATATATRAGIVSVALANPYAFKLAGRALLRQGRRTTATAAVKLGASGSSVVRLRLSKPAARTLARRRGLKLSLAVTLRAPVGKARTTRRTVTVKLGPAPRRATPRTPTRRDDGGSRGGAGFDGTYRASDGQVMVVEGGVVQNFNGDLTLYCTKSGKQKRVAYGMFGDDADPTVAADGSFAYEATRGYGFVKLKFDGRIAGDTATGKLMVEDRSPLLGGDKIDFDYCYAGKEWRLTR